MSPSLLQGKLGEEPYLSWMRWPRLRFCSSSPWLLEQVAATLGRQPIKALIQFFCPGCKPRQDKFGQNKIYSVSKFALLTIYFNFWVVG